MAQGGSQPTEKSRIFTASVFISALWPLNKALLFQIHSKACVPNGNPYMVFPGCMDFSQIVFKTQGTQLESNSTAFIQLAKGLTNLTVTAPTPPPALTPGSHGMKGKAHGLET